jgi:hypothetical protein
MTRRPPRVLAAASAVLLAGVGAELQADIPRL